MAAGCVLVAGCTVTVTVPPTTLPAAGPSTSSGAAHPTATSAGGQLAGDPYDAVIDIYLFPAEGFAPVTRPSNPAQATELAPARYRGEFSADGQAGYGKAFAQLGDVACAGSSAFMASWMVTWS